MGQPGKICLGLISGLCICAFGGAEQIVLENTAGDSYVLEVSSEDSFEEVLEYINQSVEVIEEKSVESQLVHSDLATRKGFRMQVTKEGPISVKTMSVAQADPTSANYRNYNAPLIDAHKNDIAYIVKTLANESLIKIKSSEGALKKAGDRVDHVHPLQFLYYVFSNEELLVGIRNIQGRSWVGKSFMEGLTKSLNQEGLKGNILPHAKHFAGRLNIDHNKIIPLLKDKQWDKFVNKLIEIVPRSGEIDRYNQ